MKSVSSVNPVKTRLALLIVPLLFVALVLSGCVSKATAEAQARAAFFSGQQQEFIRMQKARGPSVTFSGPVARRVIPWTEDLTLAKAIVAAGYFGPEPTDIVIVRNGRATRVDPKQLLKKQDVPVYSGDLVSIH